MHFRMVNFWEAILFIYNIFLNTLSCCPTRFAWHPHHAFFLFPEADVILEGQEVKKQLETNNKKKGTSFPLFFSFDLPEFKTSTGIFGKETHVEGGHEEGQSQEVQVGVGEDPFNLVCVLLREACEGQREA